MAFPTVVDVSQDRSTSNTTSHVIDTAPLTANTIAGQKVWIKNYDPNGVIKFLYSMMNTGQVLHRVMLY